jgi:hypothetical protein
MERQKPLFTTNSTRHETAEQDDHDFHPAQLESPVPAREEGPDPFDPEALRLSAEFSASVGVKKALLTVPVRKPAREWFVRVHPDPDYRLQTAVLELKEAGETYLVSQTLWSALVGESTLSPRILYTAINRQNVVFLWPVRLPGPDGRLDAWSKSALEAAELAQAKWVRVQSDLTLGAYSVYYADNLSNPDWPDLSFRELLRIAFKDRVIQSLDHTVLRQLRGEV